MAKTIKDFIHKPGLLFVSLGHRGWWHWMDDETYLKIAFRSKMGKKLNLDNPQSYSENCNGSSFMTANRNTWRWSINMRQRGSQQS